jgi:O-antigen biosynthesis protein WbqP
MRRAFELLMAVFVGLVLVIPITLVSLAILVTSGAPVFYWSERIGRDNRLFAMPKFRTMREGTPVVATHLLTEPKSALTPIGGFLRKSSMDELPQIWSILRGDMAFVGPRPALFNQDDLIALRTEAGVHRLKPGITGWAQVKGRDSLSIPEKVALDRIYLERRSFSFDLYILGLTLLKIVRDPDVHH